MPGFLSGVKDGSGGDIGKTVKKFVSKFSGNSGGASDSSGGGSDVGSGFGDSGEEITQFHKGGTVRKTGLARLKKGEKVLTKKQAKTYKKRMGRK